jgi:hypothetical protein
MTPDAPAREPWSAEDRARALSPELTQKEEAAYIDWSAKRKKRQVEARRVDDRGWMAEQESAA